MNIKDFNHRSDSNYNIINATYTLQEKAVLLIQKDHNNLKKILNTKYGSEIIEILKNTKTKPSIWWNFVWEAFQNIKQLLN